MLSHVHVCVKPWVKCQNRLNKWSEQQFNQAKKDAWGLVSHEWWIKCFSLDFQVFLVQLLLKVIQLDILCDPCLSGRGPTWKKCCHVCWNLKNTLSSMQEIELLGVLASFKLFCLCFLRMFHLWLAQHVYRRLSAIVREWWLGTKRDGNHFKYIRIFYEAHF